MSMQSHNAKAIKDYLRFVHKYTPSGTLLFTVDGKEYYPFELVHEEKHNWQDLNDYVEHLIENNPHTYIYQSLYTFTGKTDKPENLASITCLHTQIEAGRSISVVDIDMLAEAINEEFNGINAPLPSICIATRGGVYLRWQLIPISPAECTTDQKSLIISWTTWQREIARRIQRLLKKHNLPFSIPDGIIEKARWYHPLPYHGSWDCRIYQQDNVVYRLDELFKKYKVSIHGRRPICLNVLESLWHDLQKLASSATGKRKRKIIYVASDVVWYVQHYHFRLWDIKEVNALFPRPYSRNAIKSNANKDLSWHPHADLQSDSLFSLLTLSEEECRRFDLRYIITESIARVHKKQTNYLRSYKTLEDTTTMFQTGIQNRDMDMLALHVEGKTNKEIAHIMGISEATVSRRLRKL